jgi:hypothetical protein
MNKDQKTGSVMVVGAGIAGIQASLDLADSGDGWSGWSNRIFIKKFTCWQVLHRRALPRRSSI